MEKQVSYQNKYYTAGEKIVRFWIFVAQTECKILNDAVVNDSSQFYRDFGRGNTFEQVNWIIKIFSHLKNKYRK